MWSMRKSLSLRRSRALRADSFVNPASKASVDPPRSEPLRAQASPLRCQRPLETRFSLTFIGRFGELHLRDLRLRVGLRRGVRGICASLLLGRADPDLQRAQGSGWNEATHKRISNLLMSSGT